MSRFRTATFRNSLVNVNDGTMIRVASSSPASFEQESFQVSKWSLEKRLVEAAKRAGAYLPGEMRAQFMGLFTPEAIAITGGCLVVWAGSHLLGIGEIIDLILVVVGALTLGLQAFKAASDIWNYFDLSINATSTNELEQAGKHLASAISIIGVTTFLALLMRGGKRAGSVSASESAIADQMLIKIFGSTKNVGVLPRENVIKAVKFFRNNNLNEEQMVNALRGIDLHKPLSTVPMNKGTRLVQNIERNADGDVRVGQWFSRSGVSDRNLGLAKGNREYKVFELKVDVEVLASTASPINDTWTQGRTLSTYTPTSGGTVKAGEMVNGGGEQFFLPGAWSKVVEIR